MENNKSTISDDNSETKLDIKNIILKIPKKCKRISEGTITNFFWLNIPKRN